MNSWHEFHLVPASRPYVALPEYNLMGANIPLTYRRIDLTSYVGKTIQSQSGEWEFYIDYDKWEDWATCYRALVHYFHGFKMAVRLTDHDRDRIYVGRFIVQNYAPGGDYSKITLQYYLEPTAETDPDALNLHFMVWWLDWDGSHVSYEKIPWGSGGGDGGGDGDGGGSGNQYIIPDLPVEIRITNPPSILNYLVDASIDYSGISVVAYNSKGTVWSTSSKYPNGVIPYSELEFPISKAAFPSPQTLPVQWMRPVDRSVLSSTFSITIDTTFTEDDYIEGKLIYNYVNYDVTYMPPYGMRGYTYKPNGKYASSIAKYIPDLGYRIKEVSFPNCSIIYSSGFNGLGYLLSIHLMSNKKVILESKYAIPRKNNIGTIYANYASVKVYVPSSLYNAYVTDDIWSSWIEEGGRIISS